MFYLLLIFFTSSVSNGETTLLCNLYYYCYNYYYLIFNSLQFFFYILIRRLVVCRTCVLYEPTNGLPWDRAVFSSVIELRVTQSKGLGFFKSQKTNEMNYLSIPLKSMKDWIYEYLPWPKFTDATKQLSVSSEKWSTTLSPIRAFDFISNARLEK